MLKRSMKLYCTIALSLLICITATAQTPTQERRIYLVDVTASMEGRGAVKTPDIFNQVKKSLVSTINHIDDSRTEVFIIPFTNKTLDCFSGTIAKKDSLTNYVNNLSIKKGDTNIADAWEDGLTHIDSTRINYLFLLTDGLHNYGPTKEELYSRLSAWGDRSQGKYMFAFYVMLTENAKELEICKIVEETRNLWLIESMDIDASLIKSSTLLKTNVFENDKAFINFESNNPSLNLDSIGINLALEDNPYYEIKDVEKSVMTNAFQFRIAEKVEKKDIPIIDTIVLRITHNTEKYPFVFFTPDYIDFVIANQGTRTVSISEDSFWGDELSMLNLHKIKYKEPFRGPFKWGRALFEPTLDYPPFKWFKPDTAVVELPINITFNEEAIRGKGLVQFFFCDERGSRVDFIRSNTDSLIVASEERCSIVYQCSIVPGAREKMIHGHLFAATENLDKVNNTDISSGFDCFAEWKATYKQPWPILLWLLWILAIAAIIAVFLGVIYGIYKLMSISLISASSFLSAVKKSCKRNNNGHQHGIKKVNNNKQKTKPSDCNWREYVHKKTGWSYSIINCIRTYEEACIYINANLKESKVGNRLALIRQDIDWSAYNCRMEWLKKELADWEKWQDYNNADLIGEGYPPRDFNGDPYYLHHIGQRQNSPFAELTWNEHMSDGNNTILHQMGKDSEINRVDFDVEKAQYWRDRYSMFSKKELEKIYKLH